MHIAYIGLGANLGRPAQQLRAALRALDALESTRVQRVSDLFRSPPMGPTDQPDYCNAVCRVLTAMAAPQLLAAMIGIERAAGRVRGGGERWGPRALDLDLLHVPGVACDLPGLNLPHPGLADRGFVLVPLAQVEPGLFIPGVGAIDTLAAAHRDGLQHWIDTDDGHGA